MQTNNSIQYSFLEGSFSYLVALNRGLTREVNDRKKIMESSLIRLSRLLYYSQLPNDFVRVDHELQFIGYYMEQQYLRYQGKIQYKIESDCQNIYWAVQRLELYLELETIITNCVEEALFDLSVHIDTSNLNLHKEIKISVRNKKETYEKKLKVRKMRANDSRFYMLDLPTYATPLTSQ